MKRISELNARYFNSPSIQGKIGLSHTHLFKAMPSFIGQDFSLDEILVKPKHNQLVINNASILIEPLAMALLILLVEHQGKVLTSDELFDKLWQGRVVSDNALHRIVRQLRKALGDDAVNPRYIRTVKKSGYELMAEVAISKSLSSMTIKKLKANRRYFALSSIAFSALFFIYLLLYSPPPKLVTPPSYTALSDIQPLTSLPGFERDPVFWSQQNAVIFTHQPEGELYNNIVARSLDSSALHYLTQDSYHYINLAISADGRYLAFVRRDDKHCEIQMVPMDIERPLLQAQKLISCSFESWHKLSWSSDASRLYASRDAVPGAQKKHSEIIQISVADKVSRPLFDSMPAGASDYLPLMEVNGERLAYLRRYQDSREQDKLEVRLYHPQTKVDRLITELDGEERITGMSWYSPSGSPQSLSPHFRPTQDSALLLNSQQGLTLLTLDGERQMLDDTSTKNLFNWTLTNRQQLIYPEVNYRNQLTEFVLPRKGELPIKEHQQGRLLASSSKSEYGGFYSADDSKIHFISNREGNAFRIWQQSASSDHFQLSPQLLLDTAVKSDAIWSADDKQVLYLDQHKQLLTAQIASAKTRLLLTDGSDIDNFIWAADSTHIYFCRLTGEQYQIYQLDLADGKETQLTDEGGFFMQPSRDGQFIYFNKYNQPGLWQLSLANNSIKLVLKTFNSMNYKRWQLADNGVYFTRNQLGARGLFYLDFSSQQQIQLIENKEFDQFDISADQSRVIISEKKNLSGDLFIATLNTTHD